MSAVRKPFLLAVTLCLCLLLCGCSVLTLEAEPISSRPNLNLLSMPPYEDEQSSSDASGGGASSRRVDLWLGASRLMGGISSIDEGIYAHKSKRYREGGFHYRYENEVGLYSEVLRDLLATAEGSFTRMLRFGDERIPDSLIIGAGLADKDDADALRSVRRDLLTYAVSPMPSVFDELSGEDMKGSYYALGTPKLNQMQRFAASNGAELENPGRVEDMSRLLDAQISAISAGTSGGLVASGDDDWPLLYALQSIDLTRLSVITFDPAEMRRLSAVSGAGDTERYLKAALDSRGVFDKGLTAGLYAFTLDYMGQMASFGAADFSEPLIWGKLKFNAKRNESMGALPMPRVMLMLVIGSREHVEEYTGALNERLQANADLKELRGPEKGELEYTADGRTVTQQPFHFSYSYTALSRPEIERLTRHTEGMTIEGPEGSETATQNGLQTVLLSGGKGGSITVSFPTKEPGGDVSLDLAALENASLTVSDSLLLSETLPNEKDTSIPEDADAQVITVRDTVYVYESLKEPFRDAPDESPFALRSLKPDAEGRLVADISIDGGRLKEGYYRLLLSADLSGRQLSWPEVGWIDGADSLDATPSNEQINEWERFSALIHEYQSSVPSQFQHAWGPYSEKSYHGMEYPDFPPVYRAPMLKELMSQLRAAANVESIEYVRCVFDVFVVNDATREQPQEVN